MGKNPWGFTLLHPFWLFIEVQDHNISQTGQGTIGWKPPPTAFRLRGVMSKRKGQG
jgi:hypothetical protein